ncbi:MAG: glutamate--tRNA ligase [Alphaproteobacteria bacterium]
MDIVTRFAPSPTGYLHIGGARTALFNWLYAHHHGGRFLVRIEDTDRKRSTTDAIDAIIDGLKWLGLEGEDGPVFQSQRAQRHREAANSLLAEDKAYKCYCSPEELEEMRAVARAEGRTALYDGRWRDRDPADAPPGVSPVIRLKAPSEGETVIDDLVQGEVRVANDRLDDMVLLRADGTPTYMLSVVADDHDMGITHVIRGDDHLTNAFRQTHIYRALGWDPPAFAHIPLIHGADGAKLSKRHGALGVEAYREMGILPEALCNYLLRLGWSHGDDEIISRDQAVEWFDLDAVGRGPARFDMARLTNLNGHYLRQCDNRRLAELVEDHLASKPGGKVEDAGRERLVRGMEGLKQRAKTLLELTEKSWFYSAQRPLSIDAKAQKILTPEAQNTLGRLREMLIPTGDWSEAALEETIRAFASEANLKLGDVAQPLRAALTGTNTSPGIFEVMEVLGREESLGRIGDAAGSGGPRAP